jgi:hypothetical protein
MATQASEDLRALATKIDNQGSDLDAEVKRLTALVVRFPDLADPVCGECGWQMEAHVAGAQPVDVSDHEFQDGPDKDVPFFSETYLYTLLGKEDARSVLSAVRGVLRAAGVAAKDLP